MISNKTQLRPRYSEVDQMGYVYHANYVTYCHQARTELLREMGIQDSLLEENNIILPVISFEIKYKKAAHYDELLTIKASIKDIPKVRFNFEFEVRNENNELLSKAKSTVVFVKKDSRLPVNMPEFVEKAIKSNLEQLDG